MDLGLEGGREREEEGGGYVYRQSRIFSYLSLKPGHDHPEVINMLISDILSKQDKGHDLLDTRQ